MATAKAEADSRRYRTPRWVWLAASLLIVLYAGLALTASLQKGVSFDEGEELAVGYDIWLRQDFRMEGANGDLVKRWATLPYFISQPAFPDVHDPGWRKAQPYVLGYDFLFDSGNQPPWLLLQARAMMVLLGMAAALLVFICAKELFGSRGGLFSLALFAFSPDMLAFGGVVSTEMSTCLTLLGATWCIWRLLQRVTWARLLGSLVFCALLFLAKATALVIFPVTAVLVTVKLTAGRPLEWRLGRARTIYSRTAQTAIVFGLFIAHGIFCWGCLWAHYDFRYAANPKPSDPGIAAWVHDGKSPLDPMTGNFLAWNRRWHTLPEGYLDGMELLLHDSKTRESFVNGEWSVGHTPGFYPYTFWAKTPPVLLALLLWGAAWVARFCWRQIKERGLAQHIPDYLPETLYQAIPFVVLALVFAGVAIAQPLDIAHRHIVPAYPPLFVLAGGMAGLAWAQRKRWMNAAMALLMLGYVGGTVAIYPHYLAYFSPQAGGPANSYRRLAESSLDWGMDLPGLKSWLEKNNPNNQLPFYFSYFGTDSPDYYGIKSTRLPSYPAWEMEGVYNLQPGIYAISATLLDSFYLDAQGPWNPVYEAKYQKSLARLELFNETARSTVQRAALLRMHPAAEWVQLYDNFKKLRFGRLCAWLRHHRPPDDSVGHSILIWNLSQAEINDALNGAPAEMVNNSPFVENTGDT